MTWASGQDNMKTLLRRRFGRERSLVWQDGEIKSQLVWKHLSNQAGAHGRVRLGEREGWTSLLRLLPKQTELRQVKKEPMDSYIYV